jgi:hypothetical protein
MLAALLAAGSLQTSRAASADPSGGSTFTWDLTSSGSGQRGIAFITFSNDDSGLSKGTFAGFQMLAAIPANTNSADGGRDGDGGGRDGGTLSAGGGVKNFLFGFSPINGTWALNTKGQIFGFFMEAINVSSEVTNYFAGTNSETIVNSQTSDTTNLLVTFTNGQASVTTNFAWQNPAGYVQTYTIVNPNVTLTVGSAESTNSVSFTGKAVPGKRISLLCSTTLGKVNYLGVPVSAAADVSGDWIGVKSEGKHNSNEFFSLVSFGVDNPFAAEFPGINNFANIYFSTNGIGSGYTFSSVAMVSRKKTIGFTVSQSDGTLRATVGSLKLSKFGAKATTIGIEDPVNRVRFTANLQ